MLAPGPRRRPRPPLRRPARAGGLVARDAGLPYASSPVLVLSRIFGNAGRSTAISSCGVHYSNTRRGTQPTRLHPITSDCRSSPRSTLASQSSEPERDVAGWQIGEVTITRVLEFEMPFVAPAVLYPEAKPE